MQVSWVPHAGQDSLATTVTTVLVFDSIPHVCVLLLTTTKVDTASELV